MDLTTRMRGKLVKAVACNGTTLAICLNDGSELRVAWVDENGDRIKGRPVIEGSGVRLRAERMSDLIHLPTGTYAGMG